MAYKLLLADDSITIQKVVELTLSEEGFDVTAVGDGEAALETAGKLMPDIVLADVFMPRMDGYRLCEKLKSDPRFSGVPVMLLAGTFEEFDEAAAARVGADDRLTKPFESAELISKVKSLVEGRTAGFAATPEEEVFVAEEAFEAEPAGESDDLWSVVDMASEAQPLSATTEVISEEDLWRRANLVAEEEPEAFLDGEDMPIEELPMEAVEEAFEAQEIPAAFMEEDAAEVEPYAETFPEYAEADKTALLNMDDIQASIYGRETEDMAAIDVAEVTAEPEIMTFESLDEATGSAGYAPPPRQAAPPAAPAAAGLSEEAIREAVAAAAQSIIDARIKEALSSMTGDMIERIVWEVVPELAEEIILREVERIKAGS